MRFTVGMGVVGTRAARLVRTGWRATLLLTLLAGLAAAAAMATVAAGRRTATAFDRFAAFAEVPELLVNVCPPDVEPGPAVDINRCYSYDAIQEVARLNDLPEVDLARRGAFRGLTVAPLDAPEDRTMASTVLGYGDRGAFSQAGRYLLADGREATGPGEVLLNEVLASRSGLGVGDRALLTFWGADELGTFNDDAPELHGPTVEAEVVGIGRALTDLAATQAGFGFGEAAVLYGGPGLAMETEDAEEFAGVLVEAAEDDGSAAAAAIEAALAPQLVNIGPALGVDEIEPTRDAIRYEAQATTALGLVVAVLAMAFVGQAIARQSRREWRDGPILRAVGVTSGQAVGAALLRSLAVSIPAAGLGVGLAIALSPNGPVGIGRRAEIDPGIHVDLVVVSAGALAVVVIAALAACLPLLRGRALRPAVPIVARPRPHRSLALPPVASAGVHLARSGRGAGVEVSTALVSAAAAAIAIVAAAAMVASLDDLLDTPSRYGAPWDLSIGVPFDDESAVVAVLERPELRRAVDQAAFIRGQDVSIGGESAWVQAHVPIEDVGDGAVPLPISEGRAPATSEEIAVGALTLDDLGLSVGDRVTLANATSDIEAEVTIVGRALINDNFEPSPGRGGLVTPELFAELASEIEEGDAAILTLMPGTDVDAFAEAARDLIATPVQGPVPQPALRNVERIRELPYVMAAIVALLALVSLVHALVLSVNRNRRVLGMLKGLGFTKGQVAGTVAWHATTYALAATVIALPLGVVAGRWGWRLVARSLGVPDVPVLPLVVLVVVAVVLVVLANLAAAYPGWRAARLSTAAALRSE